MAFVREHHVLDRYLVGLHGGNQFVDFDLKYARIVCALDYEQGLDDNVCVEQRRDATMALGIGGSITHFVVQRILERITPGRNGFQCTHPVGHTNDVDAHVEYFRL